MPELPEVQTTVSGLDGVARQLTITDVWTDYNSTFFKGSKTIKDPAYFAIFKTQVIGKKIKCVTRRAKNVLIHLSDNLTILVHMKMTGHLLYGDYDRQDPYNRLIHFILHLSNGKTIELADTRKFAKITLIETDKLHISEHLRHIGPEPLDDTFTFNIFIQRLKLRTDGKIKLVLMDQQIMAGVGNIYADESLWRACIHPEECVKDIPLKNLRQLYIALRSTLKKGIQLGGDSMSDYRNIHGKRGKFQEKHKAYQKTGMVCEKSGCTGVITRIVVGGRGTHFCPLHQKGIRKERPMHTAAHPSRRN